MCHGVPDFDSENKKKTKKPAHQTWALITIPGQLYIYIYIYSFSLLRISSHHRLLLIWIQFIHINSRQSFLSLSLSLQFSVFTHTSQLLVSVAHSYLLFITFQKEKKKKEKRDGFWLSRNPSASGLLFYIGWASLIFNKNEIIPFVLSYCTGHTQLPHSNWLSPINFVS